MHYQLVADAFIE